MDLRRTGLAGSPTWEGRDAKYCYRLEKPRGRLTTRDPIHTGT